MKTFIQAIAQMEGFGPPHNRATRNNNPGNLDFAPWEAVGPFNAVLETIPQGYSSKPRFAAFPDADTGFAAMRSLLASHYIGLTVQDALNKWAPPSDGNDQSSYLGGVLQMTGMNADDVLTVDNIG